MTGAGAILAAFICEARDVTDAGRGEDLLGAATATAATTESDLFHPKWLLACIAESEGFGNIYVWGFSRRVGRRGLLR